MNHPITNHQLAKLKQAEFLQEAEAARAARTAGAGRVQPSERWLAVTTAVFLFAGALVWLFV